MIGKTPDGRREQAQATTASASPATLVATGEAHAKAGRHELAGTRTRLPRSHDMQIHPPISRRTDRPRRRSTAEFSVAKANA